MSKASSNRKCVTVQNASTSSGANVFQYQYNGSGNDEWYLERVNYGVAWPFQKLGSGAPNCFGYALKLNYTPSLLMNYDDSVSVVATRVENYVRNTLGRQIRQISGPTAEINDNEYRFCMRVGNHSDYSPNRDYHFWVQTDTGAWAEKNGNAEVFHDPIFVNPSTASWDMPYSDGTVCYQNYYNSATIYFASTR